MITLLLLLTSPKTIKRSVRAVDAAAADEQMCAWLRAEAAGRLRWRWRHIAVDGKTVRGAKDDGGKAPHLLSAYDVTAGAVLGQDGVDGKTNEISCFVPLLQAILASPRARRGDGQPAAGPGTDDGGDDTSSSGDPVQARSSQAGGGGGGGGEEEEEELVTVTADAMHTQTGHVEAINALGVAWMLILKDNQPGAYAAAEACP